MGPCAKLIELLQELEKNTSLETEPHVYLTEVVETLPEEAGMAVKEIVSAANDALIARSGMVSHPAAGLVERAGFGIGPGETDMFGWSSGIIHTQKGKIVFG